MNCNNKVEKKRREKIKNERVVICQCPVYSAVAKIKVLFLLVGLHLSEQAQSLQIILCKETSDLNLGFQSTVIYWGETVLTS